MSYAGDQNDKKELIDRVKELEIRFQQHVSESKVEREDQYEKIVILKAAKKAQEEKFQLVLNEIDGLKTQNRDQIARIVQLEEMLKTKNDATSSIQANQNNGDNRSIIPSSCEDLKLSGHHLNGIYIVFDANVKKVLATYCNFHLSSPSSKFYKCYIITSIWNSIYILFFLNSNNREEINWIVGNQYIGWRRLLLRPDENDVQGSR